MRRNLGTMGITTSSYPLVNIHSLLWKITILNIGKSTINGPFSIAMLTYQRVLRKVLSRNMWKLHQVNTMLKGECK